MVGSITKDNLGCFGSLQPVLVVVLMESKNKQHLESVSKRESSSAFFEAASCR